MQQWIERLKRLMEHDIWQEDPKQMSWFKRLWISQLQIGYLATQEIKREKLLLRAHALTYTSLLSLIPLLALMAVAFRGLGGMSMLEKQLKPWLLKTFVPQTGNQVYGYINEMLNNVSFQSLGAIGLLGFLYTAISALQRIEQSFNEVMHAEQSRRFFLRIALYWSIITLGPLLLGVSLSLQARLGQLVAKQSTLSWLSSGWLAGTVFSITLTCLAFWLLYQFVPARVINIPSALYGALSMGLSWEILKRTYYLSLSGSFKLNKVYGTLAVLPMTLIWLYITWLLVLLGAVLTYVHQHLHQFVQARQQRQLSIRATEHLCCHLMLEIARRFHLGEAPASTEELIHLTQVGAGPIEDALKRLESGGFLIHIAKQDHKDPLGYVPGRDLQTIRLQELLHHVRTQGDPLDPPLFYDIHPILRPLLERSETHRYKEFFDLSLWQLLQQELACGPEDRPPSTPEGAGPIALHNDAQSAPNATASSDQGSDDDDDEPIFGDYEPPVPPNAKKDPEDTGEPGSGV